MLMIDAPMSSLLIPQKQLRLACSSVPNLKLLTLLYLSLIDPALAPNLFLQGEIRRVTAVFFGSQYTAE